jgi:uncharacterized membrane protein YhhN
MIFRIIFAVQFIFLLIGIISVKGETVPTPVSMAISFSFLVMAFFLFIKNKDIYSKFIAAASVFCFIGDLILANIIKLGFIAGLAVFTVAQVFNVIAFVRTGRAQGKKILNKGFWVSLIIYVIIITASWFVFFKPSIKSEFIIFIVWIYGLWLSVMAASATALYCNNNQYIFSAIGALFFVASDFIAGVADVGGINIPFKTAIVWITYVIALGCIIYSRNLLTSVSKTPKTNSEEYTDTTAL